MPVINYQARDFESLKQSLIEYARQNFPDWTDLNESEQGIVLVELFSYIGDSLHYYIDKQTDEWDISKVSQRVNAIGLLKLNGYKMTGAKAAQVNETITIAAAATDDVPIPQGFKIYTKDQRSPIVFELLDAGRKIAAGQTTVAVTLTHGRTQEQYRTFDNTADQQVTLEMAPFLVKDPDSGRSYTTITIGAEIWTEVDDLLDSAAADPHFFVEVDENDRAILKFGDGISGKKPNGTGLITYRVGGGAIGNVGPGTLTLPEAPQLLDINGKPVAITVTNAASPTIKGADKESIDEARIKGPNANKTNKRTVAREDFQNHSLEVPGVARCLARFTKDVPVWATGKAVAIGELVRPTADNGHLYECTTAGNTSVAEPAWPTGAVAAIADGTATWTEQGPSVPVNIARLQIIPPGGGNASQDVKDVVKDYLYNTKPCTQTVVVDPIDPKYNPVAVTAAAVIKPGYDPIVVKAAVKSAIEKYLSDYTAQYTDEAGRLLYVLDWGMTLYPEDLSVKVDGLRSLKITAPANPLICAANEIPSAGAVVVN